VMKMRVINSPLSQLVSVIIKLKVIGCNLNPIK